MTSSKGSNTASMVALLLASFLANITNRPELTLPFLRPPTLRKLLLFEGIAKAGPPRLDFCRVTDEEEGLKVKDIVHRERESERLNGVDEDCGGTVEIWRTGSGILGRRAGESWLLMMTHVDGCD